MTKHIPLPTYSILWKSSQVLLRKKSILAALRSFHSSMGNVFRLPLPGFSAIMLVGPTANRFLLTEAREQFLWRAEGDPVTDLLHHGILVEDGVSHDKLRQQLTPMLSHNKVESYITDMVACTSKVLCEWHDNTVIDMSVEMRKITLLIVMQSLFGEDFYPHIEELWPVILHLLKFISPGPWLISKHIPRSKAIRDIRKIDTYLYQIIAAQRAATRPADNLMQTLLAYSKDDHLIRDQILTLLIAGHDTSTALLAWILYQLAIHPDIQHRAQQEVDTIIGKETPTSAHIPQLTYVDSVIKETLRIYPPIHLGSRIAASQLSFEGFNIPKGSRVLYSQYLTHHQQEYWPNPDEFKPERFHTQTSHHTAYTYIPFGAGPRNCIGAVFAQVEAKIVLAYILQRFNLRYTGKPIRPHMGATLEPSSGAPIHISFRTLLA